MTLCSHCGKKPASVQVLDVRAFEGFRAPGNEVEEKVLCSSCAQELDLPFSASAPKAGQASLWDLLKQKAAEKPRPARPARSCKTCGLTLEQFSHKGRLGCADCYAEFERELESVFEKIHGAHEHAGRSPGQSPEDFERHRRIQDLRQELDSAVAKEDYERAAQVRDALNDLGAGQA